MTDAPWLSGTEQIAWVVTEVGGGFVVVVSLIANEPRGVARLYRGPTTIPPPAEALLYEQAIGIPEIAVFAAGRNDLIETFLDVLMKAARPH